ncbi:general substrate transporter [Talaromyces proteolyticus]|uniref:General substrate transporter n=1 Tax=Talaromyces proteolyticus TaxID=1131652 RepID=A0AAD4Q3X8_9EURO|nr:general substrate transporter [Talaromyces proteolyticus]KAH8702278.1 general substrate transporter [Talaromyces proteolyticus]
MTSIKRLPFRWKNFFICFAISLGALAYGYLAAIVSTTLGKPAFLEYMGLGDEKGVFPNKENLVGAITSIFQGGAIVGCLCSCYITDTYGRKAGMIYCSVLSILGAAGLTGSPSIAPFLVFRFFAGAGSWGYVAVVPVFCSELAPPAARGFFVGMTGVMLGLGYAVANYFGLAFYYESDPLISWRAPLGIQLIFPAIILLLLLFIPESPRFYLMRGKTDQAWSVIKSIHQDPNDPDDEYARREFYQMSQQATFDRTVNSSWLQMFKRPSYRKRTLFVICLMLLSQSTAELVVNQYEPTFYSKLGFGTLDRLILQSGRNSLAFVGNLGGSFIMDRFGRRKLLLTGLAGCIVCLCIEAAMVAEYAEAGTNKAGLGVGVAALFAFLLFFSMGMDAATWVIISEIFPNFIRAKGIALAVASKSAINILYLQFTPQGFSNLGWKYFLIYICISSVGYVWLYWATPETKGIPLEEIAAIYGDKDDIMVYQHQINVDHNTHKLVVEDEGGATVEMVDQGAETQKSSTAHKEVIDREEV